MVERQLLCSMGLCAFVCALAAACGSEATATSSGAGGQGDAGGQCLACSAVVTHGGSPCGGTSAMLLSAVNACACFVGGTSASTATGAPTEGICQSACPGFCDLAKTLTPSAECTMCLETNCMSDLAACQNDS